MTMHRRDFLKFMGVGAATAVSTKVLADPSRLIETEDAIKDLVSERLHIPKREIITDISRDAGIIKLSEATSVSIMYKNNINHLIGFDSSILRPGIFELSISGNFLIREDIYDIFRNNQYVTLINDVPEHRGYLPPVTKAYIDVMSVNCNNGFVRMYLNLKVIGNYDNG